MKTRIHSILPGLTLAVIILLSSSFGISNAQQAPGDGGEDSQHFKAVSEHLEIGGEVYLYLDIDGDLTEIAEFLGGVIDLVNKASGGDIPPELAALDVPDLVDQLGLSGIAAVGASSKKRGDLYRNTYYLHVPKGREGLLKIYGGDPKPFVAKQLAPSGTDLLIEQDIDLKSMYDLAVDLVKEVGGPRAVLEFREVTGERLPGTALTIENIFERLDTKLMIIGGLNPDKPMELPEELPLKIPGFNLLVAMENVGPIFSELLVTMPPDFKEQFFEEGDGYQKITIPVPPEVAAFVQPVVYHDTKNGRVMVATSGDYLQQCLSGKSSVWDDAAFVEATKGLPKEGNAISFLSARFSSEYLRIYKEGMDLVSAQEGMPAVSELMIGLMTKMGLSPDHSQAAVMVNLPEGVLMVGNQTGSAKQGVVAMSAGFAVVAGTVMWSGVKMAPTPPSFYEEDSHRTDPAIRKEPLVLPPRSIEEAAFKPERGIGEIGADEVIVNIASDGTIILNGKSVTAVELTAKLTTVAELNPDQAVILRSEDATSYEDVVRALDACKKAKIWNVAFVTKPKKQN